MLTIAVWNRSTLVKDAELPAACAAFQRYLTEYVEPAWDLGPSAVVPVLSTEQPPTGDDVSVLTVVDDIDDPNALAYHTPDGNGLCGVKRAIAYGLPWTVDVAHELAELRKDRWCAYCVQAGEIIEPLEICDAVELFLFEIDGVTVPDFILPAYYRQGSKGPWDHMEKLTGPLTIGSGGYVSKASIGTWSQTEAEGVPPYRKTPHPLSRAGRRLASVKPEAPLTEQQALHKLQLACSGAGSDVERCCAVDALRQAGWTCEHGSQWSTVQGAPFRHDGLTLTMARPK